MRAVLKKMKRAQFLTHGLYRLSIGVLEFNFFFFAFNIIYNCVNFYVILTQRYIILTAVSHDDLSHQTGYCTWHFMRNFVANIFFFAQIQLYFFFTCFDRAKMLNFSQIIFGFFIHFFFGVIEYLFIRSFIFLLFLEFQRFDDQIGISELPNWIYVQFFPPRKKIPTRKCMGGTKRCGWYRDNWFHFW